MPRSPDDEETTAGLPLKVLDVVKRFDAAAGTAAVLALDHVSLEMQRGEILGVVGSNGAGKSTLLSVIGGNLIPDSGKVEIDGRSVGHLPSWRRAQMIGRVQTTPEANLFGSLSIEENFALRIAGKRGTYRLGRAKSRYVRAVAGELLEPFGMSLENRLQMPTQSLSSGQKQAVAVAISVVGHPEILLLDEHVAALDPKSAKLVTAETDRVIRNHAITTIMVTHDMSIALGHADRLIMLSHGRIVMDLAAHEMQQHDVFSLIQLFEAHAGEALPDRMLLA